MDAPIPAVNQAKQHLQLPRLVQGHLNLDSDRLLYYSKIFNELSFLPSLVRTIIFYVP